MCCNLLIALLFDRAPGGEKSFLPTFDRRELGQGSVKTFSLHCRCLPFNEARVSGLCRGAKIESYLTGGLLGDRCVSRSKAVSLKFVSTGQHFTGELLVSCARCGSAKGCECK